MTFGLPIPPVLVSILREHIAHQAMNGTWDRYSNETLDPRVTAVRASIRPDNAGSLATIAGFGFRKIGEQWDPKDGLENVYLRPAN